MELFFLFLILLQFLSTSAGVSLDCPGLQLCSSTNLTATCQVSSNVIAWLMNGVHVKSYSINSDLGETYNSGSIQTTLVGRNPTISTLSISIVASNSMEGFSIRCADGLSGSYKECGIQFINRPSPPANITVTNITESSIGLEWSPPASLSTAPITGYIVNVSYVNGTSFNCPVHQCNLTTGDTNKTLISGLKNDTQYLLSISAINCIGEGSYSPGIQVTTGKSSVHVSNLSFTAISYTTAELSWETSATDTVQSFFVHLYTNTSVDVASFIVYNQRLNVTNLTKGADYYVVVQAKDSFGYISDFSPSLYFTLDDPDDVEVVNSSLTLLPTRSDHNNKSAVIRIIIEYPFDERRPPIMSYLLRHNATIHGNDTYVMYGSKHSQFSIDVPSGYVGSVFTVSIAAVNALSTGNWTSVHFEIVQDSSNATGVSMTSVSSPELPFTPNIPLTTSSPVISSKTDSTFTSTTNQILLPPSMTPKPVGQQSFVIVFGLLAIPSFLLFILYLFILVCICSILVARKRKRKSPGQKCSLEANPCYETVTTNASLARQTSSDNGGRAPSFMILPISPNPCYEEPWACRSNPCYAEPSFQFSFDEGSSIVTTDNSCYATAGEY
ncbi:PREDICTED: titin-like [Amphimedon queenslandica]|uniref:Fibronectin type-III domain-containing protein n=1 Tax=Amphimedon queenslandica TaxID=400682 RepID=A0A1X7U7H7_AMPQE|nr:PREDICTED: titin-like [Amphimedon queenslandica]|eukprot:XP_019855726.1 PREDICTED: titin-like [Amphimedon queenslandica]